MSKKRCAVQVVVYASNQEFLEFLDDLRNFVRDRFHVSLVQGHTTKEPQVIVQSMGEHAEGEVIKGGKK